MLLPALKIKTSLGENTLLIDRLTGSEELSSPFEFSLDLHSTSSTLDLTNLLGTEVIVSLESYNAQLQPQDLRYFCGIVGKAQQQKTIVTEQGQNLTVYQVVIYPKFWLLKFTKDSKIFQNQKTIDIIMAVLNDNGVTEVDNLTTTCGTTVREYCVQYNESCFDFICRLLEEEGIFYFFTHTAEGHKLVLMDDSSSTKPAAGAAIALNANQADKISLNVIYQFNLQQQIVTKDYQTVDYNYLTPLTDLQPKVSGTGISGRVYDYPGRFEDLGRGENLADLRLEALEWPSQLCDGSSTVYQFSAGTTFELTGHPRDDFNDEYVLYKVSHTIDQNQRPAPGIAVYKNDFQAFPKETSFRPLCKTPKPRIYSNQTAIVTGPSGEEVFTDQYGRIKVKFFWDLYGKQDETSSCWIRVTQNWAGTSWGGLVIPRIGMEVVITYLEGDPDRPLVVGCVYNADHTPPDYVTDSPTKSTFKTNTSKEGGGFNELRFEDKKGEEEIYTHAQKDWNTEIEHSRTEEIFTGDDTLTIDKGNKTVIQTGDGTTHLLQIKKGDNVIEITKGNYQATLKEGDSVIQLSKGDYQLTLDKGDITIKVTGKINITSTDDISLKSDKNINLTAGMNITLKADQSIQAQATMNIESKASMSIKQQASMSIERKSDLTIKDQGTMITVEGQATTVIKSPLIKLQGAVKIG